MSPASHSVGGGADEAWPVLLVAAWFGVLAGFAEGAVWIIRRFAFDAKIQQLNPHMVWMAPLTDAGLLLLVGLALLIAIRFWSRLQASGAVIFVLALVAIMCPMMLLIPPVQKYAALALAGGLASLVLRLWNKHALALHVLARRWSVWPVAAIATVCIVVNLSPVIRERQAVATTPSAPIGSPNVLVIVLDTVRALSVSVNGYDRPTTPTLERIAASGARFSRAYTTAPWTLPAHASLFTGRFPGELSVDWEKPLDATYPTIAEILRGKGYLTAGFVGNTFYASYESGLPRGFAHFEDFTAGPGELVLSSAIPKYVSNMPVVRRALGYQDFFGRKNAAAINSHFVEWLETNGSRPFFAFLNYFDAHMPYVPPAPFDVKFGPRLPPGTFVPGTDGRGADLVGKRTLSETDARGVRDAYEGAIAYLDHQLGELFQTLQQRGVLDNTLVVITSDHGEQFGEHGLFDHGTSLYNSLLHVPLVISFPKHIPPGVTVESPISLRDVPATIFSLLNVRDTQVPGYPLDRYWLNSDAAPITSSPVLSLANKGLRVPPWFPTARGRMHSLIVGNYHYIRNGDGQEELYDLGGDPFERVDLVPLKTASDKLRELRESTDALLRR